jgi:hypothetical protein
MPKEEVADLVKFLLPYPDHVKAAALWLRDFVWDLYPEANELIYDNYNAVAFGWSTTDRAGDVFCSIAVYSNYVNFGFNKGVALDDPGKMLTGDGSLYRYIAVKDKGDFHEWYVKELLAQAYQNSLADMKPMKNPVRGQTIVKSISPVKRRPGM